MNQSEVTRAVLYARVSSDDSRKDGRNLQGQITLCQEYAQDKGYQIVAKLSEDDRGASGAEIDLPELTKIRDMAAAGEFDVLVVREIDRLSRNLAKQLIIEQELNKAGVQIEYALVSYEDNPEGRLSKHVRAVIAEYEWEKISERLNRGKQNKVKAGSVLVFSKPPYGYKAVKQDGNYTLEIDEDEARIVRLIFDWYVNEGLSMNKIGHRLQEMKILAPGNSRPGRQKLRGPYHWNRSGLALILKRKAYTGVWTYGKTYWQDGKRLNDRKNPRKASVPVPAIIDQATWERAARQLAINKANAKRNRKHDYLLSSRCQCARCDTKMYGTVTKNKYRDHYYYYCAARTDNRAYSCDAPFFRANQVDSLVWQWITDLMSNPDNLREKIDEYRADQGEVSTPLQGELEAIETALTKHQSKRGRWLEMYAENLITKSKLTQEISKLDQAISEQQQRQAAIQRALQARNLSLRQIDDIFELAATMKEGLEAMQDDFTAQRKLIELMDLRARLEQKEDRRFIHVQCTIGDNGTTRIEHIRC